MVALRRGGYPLFALLVFLAAALTGGGAAQASSQYRPVVTHISPGYSYTPGGRVITVRGYHFEHVQAVYFGTVRSPHVRVLSNDTLHAAAPAHAPGNMHVYVQTPGGKSAPLTAARFSVHSTVPEVTGLSENECDTTGDCRPSDTVTVHGYGFSGVRSVLFGTMPASQYSVVSDRTLTAVVPAHPVGTAHVRVQNAHGTSAYPAESRFSYRPAPELYSADRPYGRTAGGERVTLHGAHLSNVTNVWFGTHVGTGLNISDDDTIEVTAPQHPAGTVDITLRTYYDRPVTDTPFSYVANPAPVQWGVPSNIDANTLRVLSCPSGTDFCAAVDSTDGWLVEHAGAWTTTARAAGMSTLACASATFCMSAISTDTWTWDGTQWTLLANPFTTGIQQVSCTSADFCMALSDGMVATWNGTTWTDPARPKLDASDPGEYVHAISCYADASCDAVVNSTFLSFAGDSWHLVHGGSVMGVVSPGDLSCTGADDCELGTGDGDVDQLTASGVTTRTDVLPQQVTQVDCTAADSCIAAGGTSIATWDGTDWSLWGSTPTDADGQFTLSALSCPATRECTAVGGRDAVTLTW